MFVDGSSDYNKVLLYSGMMALNNTLRKVLNLTEITGLELHGLTSENPKLSIR
jgi:hypothetical protein